MGNFSKAEISYLVARITGSDKVLLDEPMKKHTSFRIGGPADLLVLPVNIEQIVSIVKLCKIKNVPYIFIGNGTNLLVRDKGIRGVVIKLFNNFGKLEILDNKIRAQAGALLSRIAKAALDGSLAGMEPLSGIPGTLGGAVVMNAGAYGKEIKDVILTTKYLDEKDEIRQISNREHDFGYRSSVFQNNNGIVLESVIELEHGNKEEIRERMKEFTKRRNEKQPVELPNSGSIFQRPEGYYTGKLIEDCGLKGFRIGGAEVSTKHCGFIVNKDNANADDVINLINFIQDKVFSQFGVTLNTEVKIIGEE